MKRTGFILFITLLLGYMLLFPAESLNASVQGINLWFHTLLPALLPFIILSGLLIHTNFIPFLFGIFPSFWHVVFGLSPYGAYAFLLGMFCGYPMGAKLTADLLKENCITKNEADYLLTISNNASPMFLMAYILNQLLNTQRMVIISFALIYVSEFICCLVFRAYYHRFRISETGSNSIKKEVSQVPLPELLDTSIMNGFESITKLGGYVLLFNILAAMIEKILPSGSVAGSLIAAMTELTSGAAKVAQLPWDFSLRYSIILAATAFGGLSCVLQTHSMIRKAGLSIRMYLTAKVLNGTLTYMFCRLFSAFFHG